MNQYEKHSEWLKYNVQERVLLSQIPAELISEMSTDELIITYLNYNFLGDIGFYNSCQQGFDVLKKQYNGFQELLKRKDVGSRLLQLYKSINLNEFLENDRFPAIRMNVIQMLLAEENVLQTLSSSEVKELLKECYSKGEQILNTKSSCFGFTMEAYVGLRCLYIHFHNLLHSHKLIFIYEING